MAAALHWTLPLTRCASGHAQGDNLALRRRQQGDGGADVCVQLIGKSTAYGSERTYFVRCDPYSSSVGQASRSVPLYPATKKAAPARMESTCGMHTCTPSQKNQVRHRLP